MYERMNQKIPATHPWKSKFEMRLRRAWESSWAPLCASYWHAWTFNSLPAWQRIAYCGRCFAARKCRDIHFLANKRCPRASLPILCEGDYCIKRGHRARLLIESWKYTSLRPRLWCVACGESQWASADFRAICADRWFPSAPLPLRRSAFLSPSFYLMCTYGTGSKHEQILLWVALWQCEQILIYMVTSFFRSHGCPVMCIYLSS